MAGLKLVCVAVVCMMLASAAVEADISCGAVASFLAPCLNYVRGSGGPPVPTPCCNGIRQLNNAAKTTENRQAACRCMKSAASKIPDLNLGTVASLPGLCGVSIPYTLSPTVDCSKVT